MIYHCVVITLISKFIYVFIVVQTVWLVCNSLVTHPIGLD